LKSKEWKVAIYIRVANADQLTVDAQERTLRKYAEENGYTNVKQYFDMGYSGLNFNRPAFFEMDADINAGAVNTVITLSTSRIGRNIIETGKWISGLRERGVEFRTVHGDYDDSLARIAEAFYRHMSLPNPKHKRQRKVAKR
jgi:DNA invertase Pin-like site-specific DNA recombinase